MKRLVVMVVAAGVVLAAVAMPTKAELQKAQEMVSDVTAADVAALKAKTKKPVEVAAKHMELAGQAASEAEKYLLLQAAFKLYAKAGDYDAAANVIEKLQTEITDYDPEVTVELCAAALCAQGKRAENRLLPQAASDSRGGGQEEPEGCPGPAQTGRVPCRARGLAEGA